MIPPFQPNGYLPSGIHYATWQEITQRLGTNERRTRLLAGMLDALRNLRQAGCRTAYIDGSFATSKQLPNDFDVAWDTTGVTPFLLHPALLVFDHRRTAQKITFMGELFPADWEADERGKTYLEFFQADQEDTPKGIIAIDLRLLP